MRVAGFVLTTWLCPVLALSTPAWAGPVSSVDPSAAVQQPSSASTPLAAPNTDTGAAAPGQADKTARFTLTAARFEGARAVPVEALDAAWTQLRGQPVSIADLGLIARRAEAIYAAHGYPFVAVLVTAQRVEGGVVHFKIIEGHIAQVAILSADATARRQVGAVFAPLVDKQPLAQSDLEGAYQRAKSVPGMTISGALRRGDNEGAMDLVVQARRQTWRTYANINNLYPDAVGPWGALVGVDHFGSSAFGDVTSLQVYSSLNGGQQVVVRGSHQQTLNASGATLSLLVLGAHAKPGRAVAALDLATDVALGRIGVAQPIIDRLDRRLSVSAAFEVNNQQTKVFSTIGLTEDRLRVLSIALQGERRITSDSGVAASLEFRQGVAAFGASRLGDVGLSRQGANPQASVGRLSLEGQTPSFHKLRLFAHLDGQVASGALTAPEQYAFGSMTVGRGYQPGAAFGDEAIAGRVEMRLGPYPVGTRFAVSPFVFCDAAELWSLTPGAHSQRGLTSVGGGVRIDGPHQTHLDLMYAAPRQAPLGLGDPTPHARVLVNLTVGLNDLFSSLHARRSSGAGQ